MEDTERLGYRSHPHTRGQVTVGSIRWRILKVCHNYERVRISASYSGLDPMEDTESAVQISTSGTSRTVTVGSIRWRGLDKV